MHICSLVAIETMSILSFLSGCVWGRWPLGDSAPLTKMNSSCENKCPSLYSLGSIHFSFYFGFCPGERETLYLSTTAATATTGVVVVVGGTIGLSID